MSEELKNMQVMIGGRSYPLRVKTEDVEAIKGVASEINEKFSDFQLTYVNKDKQDWLSMTLLTYAVENYKLKNSETSLENIGGRIDQINSMLSEVLK